MKRNTLIVIRPQSGIALVIVLWMLALLIILATGYSRMVRIETSLTSNLFHSSQALAMAEAGVWQSLAVLLKPKIEQEWKTDGTAYSFNYKQGIVKLNISDESGKIDLNAARSELLYGLLTSTGLPEQNSLELLQAILDWRDPDNLTRNNGAEDIDYQNLGYDYGAKDGPFNSLDELLRVRGMTTTTFDKLIPALTIHSHQPGINPNVAPKVALMAIPGSSEAQVNNFLQTRSVIENTQTPASLMGIDTKYLSTSNGHVFSISSEGIINETHAKLDAIVLMKQHGNKPYTILAWQESSKSSKTESGSKDSDE